MNLSSKAVQALNRIYKKQSPYAECKRRGEGAGMQRIVMSLARKGLIIFDPAIGTVITQEGIVVLSERGNI